jgi:VWFA-related protein
VSVVFTAAGCLALAAVHLIQLCAQQPSSDVPQARFRARTDLVQLDVSVLDDKRRPVRGLSAADFTVMEDGQPRPIEAFSEVYLPGRIAVAAPWVRDVPSDVATNQVVDDEGRIVIILLDRSIPAGQPTITAKKVAAAAVEQLDPGDLAAVVSTSGGLSQNLTADKTRLLRAINQSDVSSGFSSDVREIEEHLRGSIETPDALMTWTSRNDGRCLCGLCVLETITRAADAVQETPRRRKVLLFIGSDIILQATSASGIMNPAGTVGADVGCDIRVKDARTAMFAALDRANLTIHSLDPTGLNAVGPFGRTSSPVRAGLAAATNARDTIENLQHQDVLRVLPDRTGGRTVVNTNAPDSQVSNIFTESASYYLLGFKAADADSSRAFHSISVKVNRRDVTIHTRNGYVTPVVQDAATSPPPGGIRPSMRSALAGLMPSADIPAELNAVAFAAPGSPRSSIALVVSLGNLDALAGKERAVPLDILAGAFDRRGMPIANARQKLRLSLPSGQTQGRRIEVLSRLDLPPGDYEIRVAATVGEAARNASVFTYLTVPSFDSEPLALSNVTIGAVPPTATAPRDFLATIVPLVPTAQREFTNTDRLLGYVRIYQGTSRDDALVPIELRTSLINAEGKAVAGGASVLTVGQFSKARTAEHYISLPLAALTPGEYLLRLEASGKARVAGRAVRFRVTERR